MGGRGAGSGVKKYEVGAGLQITFNNKTENYFVAAGGEIRGFPNVTRVIVDSNVAKEHFNKMLSNPNVKYLSKSDVDKMREKHKIDRANTPDYELVNPFRKHGWGAEKKKLISRIKTNRK